MISFGCGESPRIEERHFLRTSGRFLVQIATETHGATFADDSDLRERVVREHASRGRFSSSSSLRSGGSCGVRFREGTGSGARKPVGRSRAATAGGELRRGEGKKQGRNRQLAYRKAGAPEDHKQSSPFWFRGQVWERLSNCHVHNLPRTKAPHPTSPGRDRSRPEPGRARPNNSRRRDGDMVRTRQIPWSWPSLKLA